MSVTLERLSANHSARPAFGTGALGVITSSPLGGGVAYVARLLALALADFAGAEPEVISLSQVHAGAVGSGRRLRFAARVLAHNALRKSDWILFGHPGIASAQLAVPRALRLPYAVQLHGTDAWDRPPTRAVREAILRIAPSRFTIERAQRSQPTIGSIALCHHGLLPASEARGEPDAALLARVGRASALIIGRMAATERYKGHDQLLECWSRVLGRVPDAQLVVVGDGDDRERLQGKAAALGVAHRVLFCGYVSDATREALLQKAALFVMPSQQEGFGLVYLEAMRAGLPCIGARNDGATEVIVHGDTGFLVQQADLEELAGAISALLGDGVLRARMGAAGRDRFNAHFTFEAYRSRLRGVLETHLTRDTISRV